MFTRQNKFDTTTELVAYADKLLLTRQFIIQINLIPKLAEVDENSPPYGSTGDTNSWTAGATPMNSSNGTPRVTCRVCQFLIDISGKKEQHVVKCDQCQEATVSC